MTTGKFIRLRQAFLSPSKALWRSWALSFPLHCLNNPKAPELKPSSPFAGSVQPALSASWPSSSCQVLSLAAASSTCSVLCPRLLLTGSQRAGQVFAACWSSHMLAASYQAPATLFTFWHRTVFLMPGIPCWVAGGLLSPSSPFYSFLFKMHDSALLCTFCTDSHLLCLSPCFFPCPWICLNKLAWKKQVPFKIPAAHWHYHWCQFVSTSTVIVAETAGFAVRFSKPCDYLHTTASEEILWVLATFDSL